MIPMHIKFKLDKSESVEHLAHCAEITPLHAQLSDWCPAELFSRLLSNLKGIARELAEMCPVT